MSLILRDFFLEKPLELRAEALEIRAGKKTAVIGPSGQGKTSFIKVLSGFLPLVHGEILWQGKDLSGVDAASRPVANMFQSHNLFMHLSLRQNVALGLRTDLRLSAEEWERVDAICDTLYIYPVLDRLPRDVSGGQAARAALARMILQEKSIYCFDEPFGALGPAQIDEIQALISENLLGTNQIVLFISHQVHNAVNWADDILWLDKGRIYPSMPVKSFISEPPEGVLEYLGANAHWILHK